MNAYLYSLPRCDRDDKVCHPSESSAREHLRYMVDLGMTHEPERLHVYRCNRCRKYHVGHRRRRR